MEEQAPDADPVFTEEMLREIREAQADVAAGNFVTAEEVRRQFDLKRAEQLVQEKAG